MNEEILEAIKNTVEEAVDIKINGKLINITNHLKEQDVILKDVKELLKERTFLIQLWSFLKFIGGVAVSIGGAILLYTKLKN